MIDDAVYVDYIPLTKPGGGSYMKLSGLAFPISFLYKVESTMNNIRLVRKQLG